MQLETIIPNTIKLTERLVMSGKIDNYYFQQLAMSVIQNACIKNPDDQNAIMDTIIWTRMEMLN